MIDDTPTTATYGDRLWAKVEAVQHSYLRGRRHVFCKACQCSFYTVPNDDGEVKCWQCGAEITMALWFLGGPPAPSNVIVSPSTR